MKKYIYIGIGGFLGAILRFLIKSTPTVYYLIPIDTLFINVSGSFLIAFITTTTINFFQLDTKLRLAICTGLLGGYTTFSTLCKETSNLIYEGHYFISISYIAYSILLGLTAIYLGVILPKKLFQKSINSPSSK